MVLNFSLFDLFRILSLSPISPHLLALSHFDIYFFHLSVSLSFSLYLSRSPSHFYIFFYLPLSFSLFIYLPIHLSFRIFLLPLIFNQHWGHSTFFLSLSSILSLSLWFLWIYIYIYIYLSPSPSLSLYLSIYQSIYHFLFWYFLFNFWYTLAASGQGAKCLFWATCDFARTRIYYIKFILLIIYKKILSVLIVFQQNLDWTGTKRRRHHCR